MAVRNHNTLPMYKVNSDLYYEQVVLYVFYIFICILDNTEYSWLQKKHNGGKKLSQLLLIFSQPNLCVPDNTKGFPYKFNTYQVKLG